MFKNIIHKLLLYVYILGFIACMDLVFSDMFNTIIEKIVGGIFGFILFLAILNERRKL